MTQPATMLAALLASLEVAVAYNQNDQVGPAAILWTDKERQWEPLLPRLRDKLNQLITGVQTNRKSTRTSANFSATGRETPRPRDGSATRQTRLSPGLMFASFENGAKESHEENENYASSQKEQRVHRLGQV